ncbi:hypothetical protein RSPO_c01699 [Ralstonia solanacearum Po82]|uniref:Uncharacterized protein n=1 Tax=Ralstonia solanacearum (strain Po82) TaxID=1031711 RepID=F6G0T0_RALS8|nr:hypothetical protein RSPO_c01699 [Ralstonia solanacearum Po82]
MQCTMRRDCTPRPSLANPLERLSVALPHHPKPAPDHAFPAQQADCLSNQKYDARMPEVATDPGGPRYRPRRTGLSAIPHAVPHRSRRRTPPDRTL